MNLEVAPRDSRFEDVFKILANYRRHGDVDKTVESIYNLLGDWWMQVRAEKSIAELTFAREHVSYRHFEFYGRSFEQCYCL